MCLAFGLLSACSFQQPDQPSGTDHIEIALLYENCLDCAPIFLEPRGLAGNHDYCAAFVSYVLDRAEAVQPSVRSARAAHFVKPNSIEARHVIRGSYQVRKGDLIVWTKEFSHIGIATEDWEGLKGRTIEGNTTAPDSNVRGVFSKVRDFSPASYFRPRYVTNVSY